MLKRIIIILLFFAFFYDLKISEPFLTVRFFMGLFGFALFLVDMAHGKVLLKKSYRSIIFVYFLLIIWNYFSCIYNNSGEYQFLYEFKFLIIIFFASYFFVNITRRRITSVSKLFDLIITAAIIQCFITVLASFSEGVHAFVMAHSNALEDFLIREQNKRLIGIGSAVFFGVLPTSSLALLACIYQFYHSIRRNKLIYIICMITISIVTYLMARTFVFVFISVCILAFLYSRNSRKQNNLLYIIALLLVVLVYSLIIPQISSEMYEWAFNSYGRNSQNSTYNEIYEWYAFVEFDIKTLLIGDAHMESPGGGYYMHTDAGYLRTIFNVGVLGLCLYFFYQYYIARTIYKTTHSKNLWYFVLAYYVFYFFMMIKGYISISKELLFLLVMIDYGRLRINEYKLAK